MSQYDAIVVGAGLSGAVLAERLAKDAGKKVLVLEHRDHIAGNCYDYRNDANIMVHHYGPHLFHTSKENVWEYLSQFTDWKPYEHKVLSRVDGQHVPLPFNLNTLAKLFPEQDAKHIEKTLIETYGFGGKVPILELRESADPLLKELAEVVYEKFFVNYTTKQWGCKPEDISPAVTARVPVVISHDDRYFHDTHQAIPVNGYTAMTEKILSHPNIDVQLGVDAATRLTLKEDGTILFDSEPFEGWVAYTGMVDALFDYQFGELPYRSLQFDFETLPQRQFQPATTVNYPNEEAFTRITEFKHILSCQSESTTIVREYPQDYDRHDPAKNIPYYPVFTDDNQAKYVRYRELAEQYSQLILLGRLADYRYYNMDDAVANALQVYEKYIKNN